MNLFLFNFIFFIFFSDFFSLIFHNLSEIQPQGIYRKMQKNLPLNISLSSLYSNPRRVLSFEVVKEIVPPKLQQITTNHKLQFDILINPQ